MKLLALAACGAIALSAQIRVGIIGTDTSHVPAFTKLLNDSSAPDHIPGAKVVAAFKGGSPDVESSHTRVDKYAEEIRTKYGVEIVPSIEELLKKVDAVLIESVDGRPHLEQARPVIAARKRFFIDKPLSADIKEAREIVRLAREAGVPWFSSSSLRWSEIVEKTRVSGLTGAITWGPGPTEEHHELDLSWYGIHAIEMLFALMGTGCEEVVRTSTPNADEVTCRWNDGRIGTARVIRPSSGYGAVVFQGKKAITSPPDARSSYVPLVREIVRFFQDGKPPVPNAETLEIFEFMEAARRSKESGGRPVRLPEVDTIRQEIEQIFKSGKYIPLPPIKSMSSGIAPTGMAICEVSNNTDYMLTALFSGPTERRIEVAPRQTISIQLPPGQYRIVGRVSASDVLPSYGEHVFLAIASQLSFYVQ
jgi:hypothetical protein